MHIWKDIVEPYWSVWYLLYLYLKAECSVFVLERQDIPDPIVIVGATRGRHNGLLPCITFLLFVNTDTQIQNICANRGHCRAGLHHPLKLPLICTHKYANRNMEVQIYKY